MEKRILGKIFVFVLIIMFIGTSTTICIGRNINHKSENQILKNDFNFTIDSIIPRVDRENIFMIGRITNLQINEDETTFNPINIWSFAVRENDGFTTWSISHTKNQNILFHISSSEFKGIITNGFIFGMVKIVYEYVPTILFLKEDKAYENTLMVISADPLDLSWNDIELQVDGTPASHGMTGEVIAGQIIDITAIAGTGAYTISIRHIPTNTLIGSYDFAAAS